MDPYVYPKTSVLKNLRDIRDPERLAKFEADATAERISQLSGKPISSKFDTHHLQAIHHHIFQDVYPWAGEFRTVNISRAKQFPFAFPEQIIPNLEKISRELARERLGKLEAAKFAARAGRYMGEINAIHPFREGNGRTQREFIRQLAVANGRFLDWSAVTREEMMEASRLSFRRGDSTGLEMLLRKALHTAEE